MGGHPLRRGRWAGHGSRCRTGRSGPGGGTGDASGIPAWHWRGPCQANRRWGHWVGVLRFTFTGTSDRGGNYSRGVCLQKKAEHAEGPTTWGGANDMAERWLCRTGEILCVAILIGPGEEGIHWRVGNGSRGHCERAALLMLARTTEGATTGCIPATKKGGTGRGVNDMEKRNIVWCHREPPERVLWSIYAIQEKAKS